MAASLGAGALRAMNGRRCVVCGGSLRGRRRDARCCSSACRREASRWRTVLAGRNDGPYSTLGQLQNRRQRRANIPVELV